MFRYIVVMSRGLGPGIILQGYAKVSHFGMFRFNGARVSEHSYTKLGSFMSVIGQLLDSYWTVIRQLLDSYQTVIRQLLDSY